MINKEKIKFVFVILVYKNSSDLVECIESIKEKVSDYRIIVVNAFFDKKTKDIIEKISKENNCVFLNIENKGYSFGNNRGIEYATNHFDYQYIIISNPDIIIKDFDEQQIDAHREYEIIAPLIKTKSGKKQNPMAVKNSHLSSSLIYNGLKKNKKFLFVFGIALGKLNRSFFSLFHLSRRKPYRIYCAHGSFVIFRKNAIDLLGLLYDENMFLFAEEDVVAYKAHKNNIAIGQFNSINIFHKEDGSMKLADFSINRELVKSNIYFYETYVMRNKKNDK